MTDAPRLDDRAADLLLALADPERPPPDDLPDDPERVALLVEAARRHGVLAIVWRKLGPTAGAEPLCAAVEAERTIATGQAMLLSHHAARVGRRLDDAGIRFALVKGETFARRLYGIPSDRPFTDVDILVAPDAMAAAGDALAAEGFALRESADHSARRHEYKWTNLANPSLLIEVHGDLVHFPDLRRRISFGLAALTAAGEGDPAAPAALLMTAILHATGSHKFHALRLLVDILQAVRRLPEDDEARFRAAVAATGTALEAAACLDLAARAFAEPRLGALAAHLPHGAARRINARLLTPRAVLDAPYRPAYASRLRRAGFRLVQHVASR